MKDTLGLLLLCVGMLLAIIASLIAGALVILRILAILAGPTFREILLSWLILVVVAGVVIFVGDKLTVKFLDDDSD